MRKRTSKLGGEMTGQLVTKPLNAKARNLEFNIGEYKNATYEWNDPTYSVKVVRLEHNIIIATLFNLQLEGSIQAIGPCGKKLRFYVKDVRIVEVGSDEWIALVNCKG
jgi:hypothetical protein